MPRDHTSKDTSWPGPSKNAPHARPGQPGTARPAPGHAAGKSVGKPSSDFWDRFALWMKRASLLAPVAGLIFVVTYAFVQDLKDRDNLYIEPISVPQSIADKGFDKNTAAQFMLESIQKIQGLANDSQNAKHPALAQPGAFGASVQNVAIPDTNITVQWVMDLLRVLIPPLRPVDVTGDVVEGGDKLILTVRVAGLATGDEEFSQERYSTPDHEAYVARAMIFAERNDQSAAFEIVEASQRYIAISALNSWGENSTATPELLNFIAGEPAGAPNLHEAYNLLGFIEIEQGDDDAAVESLKKAGNFPLALANLCYVYQDTGYRLHNPAQAQAECQQAAKLDHTLPSPHLHLGVLYKFQADGTIAPNSPSSAQDDFKQSLAEYKTALALEPGSASAHTGLGDIFGDPGYRGYDMSCSINEYQKALNLEGTYSIAMLGLANSYTGAGRWSEAAKKYQKATTFDSSLSPIANFVPLVQKIANAANNPTQLAALLNQSRAVLARDLAQVLQHTPTNLTLANKISTEIKILSAPPADTTIVDSNCL